MAFAAYSIAQAMLIRFGIQGYRGVLRNGAFPTAAGVGLASAGLFAVCGLGATRLLLPEGLRRHELLWVLPIGACTSSLGLTVLGFCGIPFKLSLGLIIGAGALTAVLGVRRRGLPARPETLGSVGLPALVAVLIVIVALVPLWRSGFATVIGDGSDAHLAAGTAEFLQHNYPTATNAHYPVDMVPLVWRSKQPIYYALGAVSTLSGRVPYEALSTTTLVLLALGALGFFVLARELLGAGVYASLAAMGVLGLDQILIHTGIHPYYNQTWGYFTLPFALVLVWWALEHRSRRGVALLGLFLALGAFAYPLALPIPLIALLAGWWVKRRARKRRGEQVGSLNPLRRYRGRRSLLWMAPLALILAIPAWGVAEKSLTAYRVVVDFNQSLHAWGGDLVAFIPIHQYFGLSFSSGSAIAAIAICACAVITLRRLPRTLAWSLGAVILFGLLMAVEFSQRRYGSYFEFKVLAFTVPLAIVCAVVAIARWRVIGPLILVAYLATAYQSTAQELVDTTNELPRTMIALRGWDKSLPANRSVRLDVDPSLQLWVAYMFSDQKLCTQQGLFLTSYPRVAISRRAEYVLAQADRLKPFDAVGPALRTNGQFRLYRLRAGLPAGPEACTRARKQSVTKIGAL
ncbi:MAG TPA: hypothetical protein VHE14_06605 [Solirubrobacteraceae bacterium]|nr:hypothetical protein [Solirubrobacteraceae bacterium]